MVLAGLTTMPMSSSSRQKMAKALTVLAATPIRPREVNSMYPKASTPSASKSSRNRFSPGHYARQNIAGPMGSPCWTPLVRAIVMVFPESIRKNRSAGRVPWHLATSGVSAGTHLATSASTAVLLTVVTAMDQ